MKKQFLIACVAGMIALTSYVSDSSAAEATGSIATSSLTETTVTGGTIGSVSTVSGTINNATSLTINVGPDVVFASTSGSITIPSGTTITSASGTAFDATAIAASNVVVSSGLGTNEVSNGALEFGISSVGLRFSEPIMIEIPVPGYVGATIAVKVKHGGTTEFVTTGLTNDPNTTCTAGIPGAPSATATVSAGIATIYTCSASTFAAYSITPTSVGSTTGGGGGAYVGTFVPAATTIVTTTTTATWWSANAAPKKITITKKPKPTKVTTTKVVVTGTEMITNAGRVNIRAAANPRSKFLGYFTRNAKVIVVSHSGNWVEVRTDQISGWVLLNQLRSLTSEELASLHADTRVPPYDQVTAIGRVNVWSAPTTKSKFLGYITPSKVRVTVTEKDATGWVKITSKYFTGWVKANMLKDL